MVVGDQVRLPRLQQFLLQTIDHVGRNDGGRGVVMVLLLVASSESTATVVETTRANSLVGMVWRPTRTIPSRPLSRADSVNSR